MYPRDKERCISILYVYRKKIQVLDTFNINAALQLYWLLATDGHRHLKYDSGSLWKLTAHHFTHYHFTLDMIAKNICCMYVILIRIYIFN